MLHASLAVPVFTLRSEGMDEQRRHLPSPYKDSPWPEPSFPFSAVEHDLPIPPASYLCARAQQAYACEYIRQMRDSLPNVTDMGSPAQRQQPLHGRFRFYSRDCLARHAHLAATEALRHVKRLYKELPIMGQTDVRDECYVHQSFYDDRRHTTGAYSAGEMLTSLRDCWCTHCRHMPKQRFPDEPTDGQVDFDH